MSAHRTANVNEGDSIQMLGDAVTKPMMAMVVVEVLLPIGLLQERPHPEYVRALILD